MFSLESTHLYSTEKISCRERDLSFFPVTSGDCLVSLNSQLFFNDGYDHIWLYPRDGIFWWTSKSWERNVVFFLFPLTQTLLVVKGKCLSKIKILLQQASRRCHPSYKLAMRKNWNETFCKQIRLKFHSLMESCLGQHGEGRFLGNENVYRTPTRYWSLYVILCRNCRKWNID